MKQTILFIFFCIFFIQKISAQNPKLVAHYPLQKDFRDKLNPNHVLTFEGVILNQEGASFANDAKKQVKIDTRKDIISDLNNFSVKVRFKPLLQATRPIISIGRACRFFSIYLLENGKIALWVNNGDIKLETQADYKTTELQELSFVNRPFQEIVFVHTQGKAILYLDNKKIFEQNSGYDKNCFEQYGGTNVSSYNYSNAQSFTGAMTDLMIFEGIWTPKGTANNNNNTNNNNNINNNNNTNNNNNANNNNNTSNNNNSTKTQIGDWQILKFPVNNTPNAHISLDYRLFFPLKDNANNLNIIWQDPKNLKITLSTFDKNLKNAQHINLNIPTNQKLLCATVDEKNNYYCVTYIDLKDEKTAQMFMHKLNSQGKTILQKKLPTEQKQLNVWGIGFFAGDLKYKNGVIGMTMGRTMFKSADGLNHQGGIAVTFDANTLEIIRNLGQTSGHSFDNYLQAGEDTDFVMIDLGDNYPRGIHLHKLKGEQRNSRVIYTFKTQHGTTADGYGRNFPKYDEISTPSQSYYKWSNDNGTYTELGGLAELNDGYMIVFAGEPDASGKSINNARINPKVYKNVDSRNLGIIKIKKDFETAKSEKWNEVPKEIVLTKGITEKGGFYDFGGGWNPQKNEGVTWLTAFKDATNQNVKNIKIQRLPNNNILILYVVSNNDSWNVAQQSCFMMCIDPTGKVVMPQTPLHKDFTLNRRDEIIMLNNQVISIEADEENKNIVLNVLNLK